MAQKPLKNLLKSKKVEKNAAKSDLSLLSTDPFAKKMILEIAFETQKTGWRPPSNTKPFRLLSIKIN